MINTMDKNKTNKTNPVTISYFTDLLCIWAYTSQIRLDELKQTFGSQLNINYHFINLFGDTQSRIGTGWADRNGFSGFAIHTQEVATQFPHVKLSNKVWQNTRPKSSVLPHLFLKAIELKHGQLALENAAWQLRLAFFSQGRDIGLWSELKQIASELDLRFEPIQQAIDDGSAYAALWQDQILKEQYKIEGSPTFYMNEGRQKLFGNLGYKIMQANIQELLLKPTTGASWC